MIALRLSKNLIKQLESLLDTALKKNDLRLYRIVESLLLFEEGYSMKEIAERLKISKRTPYTWLKKFLTFGTEWLRKETYKKLGRKPKLKKNQKEELYNMIKQGPEKNGFHSGVWNSAMINELILRKFGVLYNPRYLPTLLKNMKLSYQKAGFISDRVDQEAYEEKREKWLKETWPAILKKAKKENAVILFGDEVSFAMWGSLSRTWAPVGEQPLVKTRGIRKGLKMYGVIEFEGGGFHYMESLQYVLKPKSFKGLKEERLPEELIKLLMPLKDEEFKTQILFITKLESLLGKGNLSLYQSIILKHTEAAGRFNKEGYIDFLKQVMKHFSGNIILVEDGAPYHNANLVKEFVATTEGSLVLERLPAFSPDFNPIEKLWKNTKRDATHLKYFETFEALRESVCTAFKTYLQDASQVIRVMKKLRKKADQFELENGDVSVC
jgi:transposase